MRPDTPEYACEANTFCFETTRFRCRLLSEADQALYRSLYCCDAIMRFIMKPLTVAAAERSFYHALRCNQLRPLRRLFLPVESKGNGIALGILGINSLDWKNRSVEYGLMLTKEGQAKRCAAEVTTACLHHLTSRLAMRRVWVDISEQNIAALKVAHRAGFVPCRTNPRIHEFFID